MTTLNGIRNKARRRFLRLCARAGPDGYHPKVPRRGLRTSRVYARAEKLVAEGLVRRTGSNATNYRYHALN